MKRAFLAVALLSAISCTKSGGGNSDNATPAAPSSNITINNAALSAPSGTYAIAGFITSVDSSCGASSIDVSVTFNGDTLGKSTIAVGGSFVVSVPLNTSYVATATAGSCHIVASINALKNGDMVPSFNISSGDSGSVAGRVITSDGGYVIAGTITSIGTNCNSSTANVSVNAYTGSGAGDLIGSETVSAGNYFFINVSQGTYYLNVTAGNCTISSAAIALTDGQTMYSITLGSNSVGQTYYKAKTPSQATLDQQISRASENDAIEFKNVQIFAQGMSGDFVLSLKSMKDSAIYNATPETTNGWHGSFDKNGKLAVNQKAVDSLNYSVMAAQTLLQSTDGFCGDAGAMVAKAVSVLTDDGFSQASIAGFSTKLKAAQLAGNVCIYPQDDVVLSKITSLNIDGGAEVKRFWFVIASESVQAKNTTVKSKSLMSLFAVKPKKDFTVAKVSSPKRGVASVDSVSFAEVGFVVLNR